MSHSKLVYLDHAATSFPKPPEVLRAVGDCLKRRGGNPGRGSHRLALAAAEEVFRCRESAAALFHASPENVVFTVNTTHALNTAIKGLLRVGDHALCSDMEHNAVYRPLYRMAQEGVITFDVFDTHPQEGSVHPEQILRGISSKLRPNTRAVICAHASNICSSTLPLAEIGEFCHRRGLYFIVDGAQSAGHREIDVEGMHIDALCVPGHKGLLGPQGVGMLILGKGVRLDTLMEGGNGMDSLLGSMAGESPERYEAGTLPTPAIAGLRAGMELIRAVTPSVIHAHEVGLGRMLWEGLQGIPRVTLYAPRAVGAVTLFSVEGLAADEVSRRLDAEGICVRAGFHCSALGHRTLHTPSDGAVRAAIGYTTTEREVERLLQAVRGLGT